ncbi:MAG: protein-L-isoaspartate(D-aspartate) O-methyltransferase [Desulforhopalus sp.]|nr:protein-L-isoaspartate(D-aspartate) O-methyltransferase [Desulforhopalus sp.]
MDLYDYARSRMIEEQLVPRGIVDARVLSAMQEVPRHLFVGEPMCSRAYGDFPLPIGAGQTISQPSVVAIMTQALALRAEDSVLEIGTGSGYQAAVLSQICRQVYSVERFSSLLNQARQLFTLLRYFNIRTKMADGTLGWPEYAPFDAIIVTAGGPVVPQPLIDQLAEGGRMVIPVGDQEEQELQLLEKVNGEVQVTSLSSVRFVDLVGAHGWCG